MLGIESVAVDRTTVRYLETITYTVVVRNLNPWPLDVTLEFSDGTGEVQGTRTAHILTSLAATFTIPVYVHKHGGFVYNVCFVASGGFDTSTQVCAEPVQVVEGYQNIVLEQFAADKYVSHAGDVFNLSVTLENRGGARGTATGMIRDAVTGDAVFLIGASLDAGESATMTYPFMPKKANTTYSLCAVLDQTTDTLCVQLQTTGVVEPAFLHLTGVDVYQPEIPLGAFAGFGVTARLINEGGGVGTAKVKFVAKNLDTGNEISYPVVEMVVLPLKEGSVELNEQPPEPGVWEVTATLQNTGESDSATVIVYSTGQAECLEGATKCDGTTLMKCSGGLWTTSKKNAVECGGSGSSGGSGSGELGDTLVKVLLFGGAVAVAAGAAYFMIERGE